LRVENSRQLAFEWGAAGEAESTPSERPMPPPAPNREGALAQGLMEAIVAAENMRQAVQRVRENKGSPGVDGMTVDELPDHLKAAWPRLKQSLLEGTYVPQPVRRVEIPKPDGGTRQLGISSVVDRVIQQAILQVLSPLYDPTFSESSHGFRPKRSAHQALKQAREHVGDGNVWVVDIDLEAFFDRVNHDILMGRLARRIGDKQLLRLIRRYLQAGIMINGVVMDRQEGTPQGGPLSPLLANVLLDELDRELERRGHKFCRYADDCNIYVRSQRAGERVMKSVSRFVEKKLRLKVNRAKSKVDRVSKRDFLGFRILDGGETQLRIASERLKRFKDRVRRITGRNRGVSLGTVLEELGRYTDGWLGYYWVTQTPWLFKNLDGWMRRRIRCFLWIQWKTAKNRTRHLLAAGVRRALACGLPYAGGPWKLAATTAMHVALPNDKLHGLGFRSLHQRYHALASL
jgi:RNA-directed DNA polymerase